MKKLILSTILFCFLSVSYVFAQSVTIVPGTSPTPGIKLSNVVANRRIVLWENGNNDHEFYGLGINNNTLRYQIPSSVQSHIFYAGTGTTTSNELMRISGTGSVVIGTEPSRLGTLTIIGTRKDPKIPGFTSNAIFRVGASGEEGIDFGKINTFPYAGWVQSGGVESTVDPLVFNPLGGYIGIGTTIPTTTLDVRGSSAAITVGNAAGGGGALYLGNSSHGIQRGFPTYNANNNVGLYTTDGNVYLSANGKLTNQFILTSTGRVGIGTPTPDAPLHVTGTASITPERNRVYFNADVAGFLSGYSSSGNIQVHANGWYWADGGGFVATSDARIKNILGRTDNGADLEKLRKIAVTDYKYIDEVSNGSTLQKKVIAQQVKEIFPIAINQTKGIIPNVYQVAKKATVVGNTTQIVTTKAHDFATGDVVKLIVENAGEKVVDVTVIDNHTFSVNQAFNDKVFVYGKQVNDLHNVDYDAISMLNVSATQELAKQVDTLKAENASLKNSMSEMAAKVAEMDELKAQMASLKSLLLKTDNEKETVRVSENRK